MPGGHSTCLPVSAGETGVLPISRQTSTGRSRGRSARATQRAHGLDLTDYLDKLNELRAHSVADSSAAGEQALKLLDRILADFATALGLPEQNPSMGDSLHYLEQLDGLPRRLAGQAEPLRNTRNALAHNPDIMLRPEAGGRIIESVERIVRMSAETALHLAHRPLDTIRTDTTIAEARQRLLELGHRQLIAVDAQRRLVDLLTYRDVVAIEGAPGSNGVDVTVGEALKSRDYCAAAAVPRDISIAEVADILIDERISAAVVTEHGRLGERPLGIITRGDLLRHR